MKFLHPFTLPIGTIRSVFAIFPKAFKGYGSRIFMLATLGFLVGIFEGIGITALAPLFYFFNGETEPPTDLVSETIARLFSFLHLPFSLPAILIFIVSLFILKFITSVFYTYFLTRIQTGYELKTVHNLLKNTLEANWPYLVNQKLGKLETLVKIDTHYCGEMLQATSRILMMFATLFAYLLLSLNISQAVTAGAFVFGAVVLFLYKPLFSFARSISRHISELNVSIAHHINESLIGLKTIKALGAEEKVILRGNDLFNRLRNKQLRLTLFSKITTESLQPLSMVFLSIIIAFAFYRTSYNLGALAALVYLIQHIFQHIQSIQGMAQNISTVIPYVENMTSYIGETQRARENYASAENESVSFSKSISFKSVAFSYVERKQVINKISFSLKKGEMVGFIGPSGAGKTTIFDLFLRFLVPTEGEILIDDKNISSLGISAWRKNLSYVSQDVFLLNDTISNNIKFFDDSVTEKDVHTAARLAEIYDFIETLPEKFDTQVGERGALLSVGQRQRIALARALARKPEILLLDEATSALDNESEQRIQKAIENLRGNMTILVIAHRLSTVLNTDRLLVIEKGKIVEEGSPQALLKDKETYFHKVHNLRT
ncbi:MAG: ABC transporter ATP-binding protein [bacterium]|nr:ABC transporter ATP-binding protein [bacterium]